ncbi:sulfite exporter TauE/SafE family protein [Catenovulum sp. 2E275]|uniref:sulfite exporter TauE/SafE family protein n=1 Tax=Catenovulum sp. 2E275 TaxID=2980497 RepID=UPI0021D26D72|nr:sulfite exporter TauE/SafE family protein [Catenovulum sp. 2E275]MCU4674527.1 sulfite exporter TauE/SafE family protein [Catenovulum sp. 2E275]
MSDYLAAIIIGLSGASHCLVMCGGLSAAMGLNKSFISALLYNLGRISSYTIAGFLLGYAGLWLTDSFEGVLLALRLLAGIMLILLGLYISRLYMGLIYIEKIFGLFWRLIAPLAQKSISTKSLTARFFSGMLWGWLPCGLVYSTLTFAATQANPLQSAFIMLCFGVGTLPALLLSAQLSQQLGQILKHKYSQYLAGLMLIMFGAHTLYITALQLG